MRLAGRVLAALLAVVLVIACAAIVAGNTIWSATYLERQAQDINIYDSLAAGLPGILAAGTSSPELSQLVLSQLLSSNYLKAQVDDVLPALEKYWRSGGDPPRLDLRDLAARLDSTGLAVPADLRQSLSQPIALTDSRLDGPISVVSRQSGQLQWLAPLVAAVLVAIIVLVGRRRRFIILMEAALGAALGCVALAGLVQLMPHLVASNAATSILHPLESAFARLGQAVANDMTRQLLWSAVGLAVVSLVLGAAHVALLVGRRFGRSKADA